MMSKAQKLLSGRAISVLLAFSTCLVLLASACGEPIAARLALQQLQRKLSMAVPMAVGRRLR